MEPLRVGPWIEPERMGSTVFVSLVLSCGHLMKFITVQVGKGKGNDIHLKFLQRIWRDMTDENFSESSGRNGVEWVYIRCTTPPGTGIGLESGESGAGGAREIVAVKR